MRRESLYLADILEAADHIASFIANADFDEFCRSELRCDRAGLAGRSLWSLRSCFAGRGGTRALLSASPSRRQLRSAVVQKLAVIGEAAGRISADIRERYPEIPWPQIVAFRNVLVHSYFGIDWEIVWRSAKERCPQLRVQIARILGDLRDADDRDAG